MLGAVTDLGVALITGGFTIGAVVVTFGGNALLERARARRAARESRNAAIAEVLAASIDLVLAVAAIRAAHEHRTNRRMRLFIAAALLRDLPDLDSWKALTDRSVQRVALSTLTGLAREQDADTRMIAMDFAGLVVPPAPPETGRRPARTASYPAAGNLGHPGGAVAPNSAVRARPLPRTTLLRGDPNRQGASSRSAGVRSAVSAGVAAT